MTKPLQKPEKGKEGAPPDPRGAAAKKLLMTLGTAIKSRRLFPAGHPKRGQDDEAFHATAAKIIEEHGEIALEIDGDAIVAYGDRVHEDGGGGPVPTLARSLYGDGLRELRLLPGLAREEADALLGLLATTKQENTDLVVGLFELGLAHVLYDAIDELDEDQSGGGGALQELLGSLVQGAQSSDGALGDLGGGGGSEGGSDPLAQLGAGVAVTGEREPIPEAPLPPPVAADEVATGNEIDLMRRTAAAVAANDSELSMELATSLVHRALELRGLEVILSILTALESSQIEGLAEKVAAKVSKKIFEDVPKIARDLVGQGSNEEEVFASALKVLSTAGPELVPWVADTYLQTKPGIDRRLLRRYLSAYGKHALDKISALAMNPALDIAQDALGILAVIDDPKARERILKIRDDVSLDENRRELAEKAFAFRGTGEKLPPRLPSLATLKDKNDQRRIAALQVFAGAGPRPAAFPAIQQLVQDSGFKDREEVEQKIALEALVATGGTRAAGALQELAKKPGFFASKKAHKLCELAQTQLDVLAGRKGAAK